jgi:signal peptidase I
MAAITASAPNARWAGSKDRNAPGTGRLALRVAAAAGTVLAGAIASLAVLLAVVSHLSPAGQYTLFGHPVMTVLSGSMTPVFRTGDMIIDNPVTAAQASHLQPGQIASFREAPGSTSVITHRIIAVKVTGSTVSYVTKGDANNAADDTLRPASDVIGVFSTDIPRAGYILADLHRPLTDGLLLASLALAFTAGPLLRYARRTDLAEPAADPAQASADVADLATAGRR